jgi:acetyltransferase-like isoleucine patch superfamily enzyme
MSDSHQKALEDPVVLLSRAVSTLRSLWMAWTYPFASIGKYFWIHHSCELSRTVANHIRLGANVALERGVWLNISGAPDGDESVIILEDGCKIGRRCTISAKNRVHVGRNTIFGPSVLIVDHNHAFEDVTLPISRQGTTQGGTIRIEEGCWIGFRAAVVCDYGELVIGRNSVVGANSVVTRSVPPCSVVAGNPARIVKQYDPSKKRWVLGAVRSEETEYAK